MTTTNIEYKNVFSYETTVRVGDLNFGNHLAHDKLLTIIHDARAHFLLKNNFSELDSGNNCGLMISKLDIEYKKEAYFPDKLFIKIFVQDLSSASFNLLYNVYNIKNEIVAICHTKMVNVSAETRKVTRISAELKSILI